MSPFIYKRPSSGLCSVKKIIKVLGRKKSKTIADFVNNLVIVDTQNSVFFVDPLFEPKIKLDD